MSRAGSLQAVDAPRSERRLGTAWARFTATSSWRVV